MGLSSARHAAIANFAAGWVRDLPKIAEQIGLAGADSLLLAAPALAACLSTASESLLAQGVSNVGDVFAAILSASHDPKLAHKWRSDVVTRTRQSIESGASSDLVTSMRESGGIGSGAWLSFPSKLAHYLSDQEYCLAVRLHMSLDVFLTRPHENLTCMHKGGDRAQNRICRQSHGCKRTPSDVV